MAVVSGGDRQLLATVNIVASTLSLIGSSFIVLCYILFKELRKFSFKLVFYLALAVTFFLLFFHYTIFFFNSFYSLFIDLGHKLVSQFFVFTKMDYLQTCIVFLGNYIFD